MGNQYRDMSALTALKYVKDRKILLPDIQREYVWEIEEIERLFESIVDNYPIGSCILWKTNRKIINKEKPNLYYFLRDFVKNKSKNEKAPEVFAEEDDYYVVLDGQQRITSLNIALNGSYTYYKGGKGCDKNNPKYWVKKELYYNLKFYDSITEEDDENHEKRFVFLSELSEVEDKYYKVKNLLAFDNVQYLIKSLYMMNISDKCINDLTILYTRLSEDSGKGLIHYYCISEENYDNALNIFVRVNSSGKKLSKSDLLFSTLIDGWTNGKEKIENLLAKMNNSGDGFNFSRDYLMRLCLVLVDADTSLKINSLTRETISKIRDKWYTIVLAVEKMIDVLIDAGMSDENLTSYNSTMPIAYYLYNGGEIKDEISRNEVKKYLFASLAKRLFGVASNEALKLTRNALKNINCERIPFRYDIFTDIILTGNRTFVVTEADIDYWLDNYKKGPDAFILLSLIYPYLKYSQVCFHQDHCHPYCSFERNNLLQLGLSEEKIVEWQRKRDLVPNLQFLAGRENESKNKTPLKIWCEEGNDFAYHPIDLSLEFKDFETFFNKRRELIKSVLMKIFDLV